MRPRERSHLNFCCQWFLPFCKYYAFSILLQMLLEVKIELFPHMYSLSHTVSEHLVEGSLSLPLNTRDFTSNPSHLLLRSRFLSVTFIEHLNVWGEKNTHKKLEMQGAQKWKWLTHSIILLLPLKVLEFFFFRIIISFFSQLWLHYLLHFLEFRDLYVFDSGIFNLELLSLEFTSSGI